MPPPFFYSDALLRYDMGPQHPLRPVRLRMTRDLLDCYGVLGSAIEVAAPEMLDWEEAAETHSRDYLEMVNTLDGGEPVRGMQRYGFGGGDNPIFEGIYGASLLYAGASAQAAQALLDGDQVAFNISGGLHHAHHDRAAGFCVLNDCAVAARRLRRKFARVAYVDIDVHHGDGVQELFYSDPTVLTISLHESGRTLFPGTGFVEEIGEGAGEGFSVNVPFAPYTTDAAWLEAWRAAALPLLRAFDPGAIVLQMGTDAHELDPLAHVCLTAHGWLEAVKDVRDLGKPIVALGGGGYNLTTVPRMWTLAVAALTRTDLPDAIPASYPHRRVGLTTLTDHAAPQVGARELDTARRFAANSVAEVKELLFARHGLTE
ncbi:MAG TPA: acetoin utilization protein AcuC [Chthonomonadaceae bacterium]|nr:acetoin utilization protein AcuC [Chthonomonadaceae bacterium]